MSEKEKTKCFGCGQEFFAIVVRWTDPNGKPHKFAPMRCPQCIEKKQKPRQRELWHASKDP